MELVHDTQWSPGGTFFVLMFTAVVVIAVVGFKFSHKEGVETLSGGTAVILAMVSAFMMMTPAENPNLLFNDQRLSKTPSSKPIIAQLEQAYDVDIISLGSGFPLPWGKETPVRWQRDGVEEVCDLFPDAPAADDGIQHVEVFCGNQLIQPTG